MLAHHRTSNYSRRSYNRELSCPVLLTVQTADEKSANDSCPFLKFTDNTDLVGLITKDKR